MRLNFEFSEERIAEIKELQADTETETMKELVNNALTMLEWAVQETKGGNEIAAVNESKQTFRVLILPLLQRVARRIRTSSSAAVRDTEP